MRRIHIHKHYHPKREVFKDEDSISRKGQRHIRVCPNCGYHKFHIIPGRFNFILGQKSRCNRCGFIFKRPYTELEYRKSKGFVRSHR